MALVNREWTTIDKMNVSEYTKITYKTYFKKLFEFCGVRVVKGETIILEFCSEINYPWYKIDCEEKFLEIPDSDLQLLLERFLAFYVSRAVILLWRSKERTI